MEPLLDNMSNKKRLYIGMGGAGNAILHAITKNTSLIRDPLRQAAYINFAASDLTDAYKGERLILDEGGTGRDPKVGRGIVQRNLGAIEEWFERLIEPRTGKGQTPIEIDDVIIISSLGGGTGSSLIDTAIDSLAGRGKMVTLIGILPADKEGVATLPNAIKTYQNIYNTYVIQNILKSFFVFDNEKMEKAYGISQYDWTGMNEKIAEFIAGLYDEETLAESSSGFSSLDIAERRRVLNFGQGAADYIELGVNFDDDLDEVKVKSSIYNGSYKYGTAKAAAVLVRFKLTARGVGDRVEKANAIIEKMKKTFRNAFFVWGFNFDNKLETDMQVRAIVNGLSVPNSLMVGDVKRASKGIAKVKEKNDMFSTGEFDLDL